MSTTSETNLDCIIKVNFEWTARLALRFDGRRRLSILKMISQIPTRTDYETEMYCVE